jgi:hypothetical protein
MKTSSKDEVAWDLMKMLIMSDSYLYLNLSISQSVLAFPFCIKKTFNQSAR